MNNSRMVKLPESVVINKPKLKIESPEGFVDFLGVNKITKDSYLHLKFSNGSELKCSEDHPLMTVNGVEKVKNISKNTEIYTKDGTGCFIVSKRLKKKKIDLFDIVNSGTKHLYYSNGLVSHNCDFIGSSSTLINGQKIAQLMANMRPPLYKDFEDKFDIFEEPIAGHTYTICVDVSEGLGQDYSTFTVINVTEIPYKVVAKYRNNTIAPMLFPTIIYTAGKKYNDAFVLVEINSIGLQVADTLHFELDYENLIKIQVKGKQGQQTTQGFGKKLAFGIKTSKQTKNIGCANLKTLIESDKLILWDEQIIAELTTFSVEKGSFKAEQGSNDDLVMSLVNFGWLTAQRVFKDTINSDIRSNLQQEQLALMDQNITPFGIRDDGLEPEYESDGIDQWYRDRELLYPFDSLNFSRYNF